MARTKGATDRKKRKSRVVPDSAALLEDCRRRFRERFGREWSDQCLDDVFATIEARPTEPGWRGALMFVAANRRLLFADPRTMSDTDLAVVSFLCGMRVPRQHRALSAAEIINRERATIAKHRAKQRRLDTAVAIFAHGLKAMNEESEELKPILQRMKDQGFAEAESDSGLREFLSDVRTARVVKRLK